MKKVIAALFTAVVFTAALFGASYAETPAQADKPQAKRSHHAAHGKVRKSAPRKQAQPHAKARAHKPVRKAPQQPASN